MTSEETVELDYDDPMDDKAVEMDETLESGEKTEKVYSAPTPSVFTRIEGLKREKEEIRESDEETNHDRSPSDIFASGRVSFAKADENRHQDEDEGPDSDGESGEKFKGKDYPEIPTDTFPSFPITQELIKADLAVTHRHLRNAIFVYGVENINEYSIMKIFCRYGVSSHDPISNKECLIQFDSKKNALKMMAEMSKTLTLSEARFEDHAKIHKETTKEIKKEVKQKRTEEGEVSADEDDEGEFTESDSTSNCFYKTGYPDLRVTSHVVYINPKRYHVPDEKWRVVTSHIGKGRVVLVRFATQTERASALAKQMSIVVPTENVDEKGLKYTYSRNPIRPGLNIFDNKGEELEWDFQHDTRFYKGGYQADEFEDKEWKRDELQVGIKGATKVRGRGAKRFLGEDSATLNADELPTSEKKQKESREDSDDEDWRSSKPSTIPTKTKW